MSTDIENIDYNFCNVCVNNLKFNYYNTKILREELNTNSPNMLANGDINHIIQSYYNNNRGFHNFNDMLGIEKKESNYEHIVPFDMIRKTDNTRTSKNFFETLAFTDLYNIGILNKTVNSWNGNFGYNPYETIEKCEDYILNINTTPCSFSGYNVAKCSPANDTYQNNKSSPIPENLILCKHNKKILSRHGQFKNHVCVVFLYMFFIYIYNEKQIDDHTLNDIKRTYNFFIRNNIAFTDVFGHSVILGNTFPNEDLRQLINTNNDTHEHINHGFFNNNDKYIFKLSNAFNGHFSALYYDPNSLLSKYNVFVARSNEINYNYCVQLHNYIKTEKKTRGNNDYVYFVYLIDIIINLIILLINDSENRERVDKKFNSKKTTFFTIAAETATATATATANIDIIDIIDIIKKSVNNYNGDKNNAIRHIVETLLDIIYYNYLYIDPHTGNIVHNACNKHQLHYYNILDAFYTSLDNNESTKNKYMKYKIKYLYMKNKII